MPGEEEENVYNRAENVVSKGLSHEWSRSVYAKTYAVTYIGIIYLYLVVTLPKRLLVVESSTPAG